MGLCGSKTTPVDKDEVSRNKAIQSQLAAEQSSAQQVPKVLLLGAGESGKSTLFKQMIKLYGPGFDQQTRAGFVAVVHQNLKACIDQLITQSERFAAAPGGAEYEIAPNLRASREFLVELKENAPLTPQAGQHIAQLWQDKGVRATFARRSEYQLMDSAAYFLDKAESLCKSDYMPSEDDIFHTRVRTTGVIEKQFDLNGLAIRLVDVGGQRSERRKWIHCFQDITAVLFVAAISEYDQRLFEDETVNRMAEALTIFKEICNSHWFRRAAMILFLNKRDIFEQKIRQVPLTVCFPEYKGANEFEPASAFIAEQFAQQNTSNKLLFTHVTNATDSNNMVIVFGAVKDVLLRTSLGDAGLM